MKVIFRCGFIMIFCLLIFSFSAQAAASFPSLRITTHNVYFMPQALYPNWGQMQRADLIAEAPYIQNNDVIILNELFDRQATNQLQSRLRQEYPYQTPVLGNKDDRWDDAHGYIHNAKVSNGGVGIVSRYPIARQEQHIYAQGHGADAMAKKGFVYVKIIKQGQPIHIIGTHLQADNGGSSSAKDAEVRARQMAEIHQFIEEKHIPKNEMVLIGGDLNVQKGSQEYQDMLSNLNVSAPTYQGHNATWDTETNGIARYNYPDYAPQYLDYILVEKHHAKPSHWSNEARPVKSPQWSVTSWGKSYTYQDFSDHYPVIASNSQ
nr:sphingomyelin phosphodiesterase [Staphylococcus chromogenes]